MGWPRWLFGLAVLLCWVFTVSMLIGKVYGTGWQLAFVAVTVATGAAYALLVPRRRDGVQ